MRGDDPDPFVL